MNASAFRTVAPYYLFNTIPAVILDILQYGHPALREKCSPIVHINSDILNFLKDMQETLAQAGIGLAAPQVGRPIQMVTINIPLTDTSTTWLEVDGSPATLAQLMPLNFINPVLHLFGKKVPYREGCLSISKVYADVMRRSCVKATLT
ncbi:MAG: peptide deformylase, partial [Akkermansia sp.]